MKLCDADNQPVMMPLSSRTIPIRKHVAAVLITSLFMLTSCSSNVDSHQPGSHGGLDDEASRHEAARQDAVQLRSRLHRYMSNHQWLARSREWDILEQGAATSASEMRLFYTRRIVFKSQRASGTDQAEPDYWNREHLWPRSYGLKGSPADRDLHNLVPADRTVNSSRGNKMFATAAMPHRECVLCRVSKQAWEPPDEIKGDIARALFYMDVRYEGETGLPADNGLPDLVLAEHADPARKQMGSLHTLLQWNCQDPVSAEERRRHEVVVAFQGNRNVFVDDPSLAAIVYQYNCPSSPLSIGMQFD